MRSDAVLSSLMGDGRCQGEEPRLPSRLPVARAGACWGPGPRCGVCAGCAAWAEPAEPCGEDAGVTVEPDSGCLDAVCARGSGAAWGWPLRPPPVESGEPVE
mmetsp:Transcript_85344/g.241903  ORF Transcript_85344/g.241903 Transcript_85344/m.241903 type:complete len:102 (+) Transcript_85344:438-743(+)